MLLKEGGEIDDNFNLAKILNCTDYKEFVWPMSKSLCKIKEWKWTWKLGKAKKKKYIRDQALGALYAVACKHRVIILINKTIQQIFTDQPKPQFVQEFETRSLPCGRPIPDGSRHKLWDSLFLDSVAWTAPCKPGKKKKKSHFQKRKAGDKINAAEVSALSMWPMWDIRERLENAVISL